MQDYKMLRPIPPKQVQVFGTLTEGYSFELYTYNCTLFKKVHFIVVKTNSLKLRDTRPRCTELTTKVIHHQ